MKHNSFSNTIEMTNMPPIDSEALKTKRQDRLVQIGDTSLRSNAEGGKSPKTKYKEKKSKISSLKMPDTLPDLDIEGIRNKCKNRILKNENSFDFAEIAEPIDVSEKEIQSLHLPDMPPIDSEALKTKRQDRLVQIGDTSLRSNAEGGKSPKTKYKEKKSKISSLKMPDTLPEIDIETMKKKHQNHIFDNENSYDFAGNAEFYDVSETEISVNLQSLQIPEMPEISKDIVSERIDEKKKSLFNDRTVKDMPLPTEITTESKFQYKVSNAAADKADKPTLFDLTTALMEKVNFIHVGNKLYYFNGICYAPANKEKVVSLYRQYVDVKMGGAKSMTTMNQLYNSIMTLPPDYIDTIDNKESCNFVSFRNGVYDIMSGTFTKCSPEMPVFSYLNADYIDPENAKCPTFMKFLDDITGGDNKTKIRFMEVLGYIFSLNRKAKAFFYMGIKPHSGKSQLGSLIQEIFPVEYRSNVELHSFGGRFDMSTMADSYVNLSMDLPNEVLSSKAVSAIKKATGSDTQQIDIKNKTPISYRSLSALVFAGNFQLRLKEYDQAFWDRLVFLPFKEVDEKFRDPDLLSKLIDERDAIVSHTLRYIRRLIKNNYKFTTTPTIEATVNVWAMGNEGSMERFFENFCRTDEEYSKNREALTDIYKKYKSFCDQIGCTPVTQASLRKFLVEEKGIHHEKLRIPGSGYKSAVSAFEGIKLVD